MGNELVMSKENPIAIARQYFDYVQSGEPEEIAKFFAEDALWHQPGASAVSGMYLVASAIFVHWVNS